MGKWSLGRIGAALGTYGMSEVVRAGYKKLTGPGEEQAEQMGKMAEAKQTAASEELAYKKETRRMAMEAAEPSYAELAAIGKLVETRGRAMQLMERNLANEERLLASVDPALREAGMQAYELLRGKDAPILDPIRRQRERSRTGLENTLASQLGSGWATSSAGMQALNDFDMQTDTLMANAQQQTIGTLLGVSATVRPNMTGQIATMGQIMGQFSQAEIAAQQNIATRKVNAISGTPVSFQNVIATAGGQYAGEMYKQQMKAQTMGQLMQLGGTIGGAVIGGPAGAAVGGQMGKIMSPQAPKPDGVPMTY